MYGIGIQDRKQTWIRNTRDYDGYHWNLSDIMRYNPGQVK